MIAFAKSVPFGAFLSWILSMFMGSGGTDGGVLHVHMIHIENVSFYWSWTLFFAGTALTFALLVMMGGD